MAKNSSFDIVSQIDMQELDNALNQTRKEIYTDCYVKVYSPDGFMQGYGMRSDDRMQNWKLNSSFNNYVYVVKDTTAVILDSVNFIGPFPKKINKFAP